MSRRDMPRTYTILNESIVDESGAVVAGMFGGVTRALPAVAQEVTLSEIGSGRPSLWWLPQDLAIGGGLILSALRVAMRLQLLPVLDRAAVSEATEIVLVTAVEVAVPSYVNDAPQRRASVRGIRAAIADLVAGPASATEVRRVADLIEQLGQDHPGDHTRTASLALLRFPHLEGTRDHPALLVGQMERGSARE